VPQLVACEAYSSSLWPSQSSSKPSQVGSLLAGVPGTQLSCSTPPTQLVAPTEPQPPVPQLVACET
jgi:hypothetical protein